MIRKDGREMDQLRPVRMTPNYIKWPEGSLLIEVGETRVLCNATVEEKVPPFLKGCGQGWITAEYAMLPRSTQTRTAREVNKGKPTGRTSEIQRLIGRSLRSVVDMNRLGERTIMLDCDVLQADGGTRTAAITGAFVAMCMAMKKLKQQGQLQTIPVRDWLAAISVGMLDEGLCLDLAYEEDSRALVDMNVVMTGCGNMVELQGTAEGKAFSRQELNQFLDIAEVGIRALVRDQKAILGEDFL